MDTPEYEDPALNPKQRPCPALPYVSSHHPPSFLPGAAMPPSLSYAFQVQQYPWFHPAASKQLRERSPFQAPADLPCHW